jgi:hypothetical protein
MAWRLAGVSSTLGAMLLTWMPCGASSAAAASTRRCNALFEAM